MKFDMHFLLHIMLVFSQFCLKRKYMFKMHGSTAVSASGAFYGQHKHGAFLFTFVLFL